MVNASEVNTKLMLIQDERLKRIEDFIKALAANVTNVQVSIATLA